MTHSNVTKTYSAKAAVDIEMGLVVTDLGYIANGFPATGTIGNVMGVSDYSVKAGEMVLLNCEGIIEAQVGAQIGQYDELTVSGTDYSTSTIGASANALTVNTDGRVVPVGTEDGDTYATLQPTEYAYEAGDTASIVIY